MWCFWNKFAFAGGPRHVQVVGQGHDRRKVETINCQHQRFAKEEFGPCNGIDEPGIRRAASLFPGIKGICVYHWSKLCQIVRGLFCWLRGQLRRTTRHSAYIELQVITRAQPDLVPLRTIVYDALIIAIPFVRPQVSRQSRVRWGHCDENLACSAKSGAQRALLPGNKENDWAQVHGSNVVRGGAQQLRLSHQGRGRQPIGDRVRPVRVQGPSNIDHTRNAGESAGRTAATVRRHNTGRRFGGSVQARRSGANCRQLSLFAGQKGWLHHRHVPYHGHREQRFVAEQREQLEHFARRGGPVQETGQE